MIHHPTLITPRPRRHLQVVRVCSVPRCACNGRPDYPGEHVTVVAEVSTDGRKQALAIALFCLAGAIVGIWWVMHPWGGFP